MARRLRSRNGSGGREGIGAVRTTHSLLTSSWKADVQKWETAIGQFSVDRTRANDCQVAFFEIAGDGELHVNVTHEHRTMAVPGWVGPAELSNGFVHNRRFADTPAREVIRHIRQMVFARRTWSGAAGTVA